MLKKKIQTIVTIAIAISLIFLVAQKSLKEKSHIAHNPYRNTTVEERYKWNLRDIYITKLDWDKSYESLKKDYTAIQIFKGKLNTLEKVKQCFKMNEDISRRLEKLYLYARLKSDLNQKDAEAYVMLSKIETLSAEVISVAAFIEPELLKLPENTLKQYISSKKLISYQHYFEVLLNQKQHLLSEPEEKLLGLTVEMSFAPKNIYDKLTLADLKFPTVRDTEGKEIELSASSYYKFLTSADRSFRRRVFDGIFAAYDANKYTLAATLSSQVKNDIFYAKARKYPSSLVAALASENIPKEVYVNLISDVNKHLKSLHRYVNLRKKILKLNKVYEYDIFVPLTGEYYKEISFPTAKKQIISGLHPLGKDYLDRLQQAFDKRWIDVYETENKYTGNYNTGSYDTHPYVLLNYNNNFESMMTLAHELGHSLHACYSNERQQYINANVSIFTSEVAAATNELLMFNYLIKNSKSDKEKIYLLNKLIEDIRGAVFTQVMFAEFEQTIHERAEHDEALPMEELNKLWANLRQKYYGKNLVVDERANVGWARIPHFYMSYYVYKYATSMSAAHKLTQKIINKEPYALDKYLNFLASGSADYPIELLSAAGVNMQSSQPVEDILIYFDSLITELELLLKANGQI